MLPAKLQPYAKTVVAVIGVIVAWVVTAFPSIPAWVGTIPALLTAVAVYLVPNTPAIASDPARPSLATPPADEDTPAA